MGDGLWLVLFSRVHEVMCQMNKTKSGALALLLSKDAMKISVNHKATYVINIYMNTFLFVRSSSRVGSPPLKEGSPIG